MTGGRFRRRCCPRTCSAIPFQARWPSDNALLDESGTFSQHHKRLPAALQNPRFYPHLRLLAIVEGSVLQPGVLLQNKAPQAASILNKAWHERRHASRLSLTCCQATARNREKQEKMLHKMIFKWLPFPFPLTSTTASPVGWTAGGNLKSAAAPGHGAIHRFENLVQCCKPWEYVAVALSLLPVAKQKFGRPKRFLKFYNGLSKYSTNSLYCHIKILWNLALRPIWYSYRIVAVSQNIIAVSKP